MKSLSALLVTLRRLHGRIGVLAALFFLLLALSGVALNHGHELGLNSRRLHSSWLASWYGMPRETPLAFRSHEHRLLAANGQWVLDGKALSDEAPRPLGFVTLAGLNYVADSSALYIYQDDGLVEKLGRESLPGAPPLRALGTLGDRLVIEAAGGRRFASADGLLWQPITAANIQWSAPAALSEDEQTTIARRYAPAISWERLLQDLHSGRFFGSYGPIAMDIVAVFLTVLVISGASLHLRRHRRRRQS